MKKFLATGLMSGTSLDGLDIAHCRFSMSEDHKWTYKILCATTLPYDEAWRKKLMEAEHLDSRSLAVLNEEYGAFLGQKTRDFLNQHGLSTDLIASHGHTVFHQPEDRMSLQIGSGAAIAAITGKAVAWDFRSGDLALGGQGAPLVPAGDYHLFGDYRYCLNIGGIANISFREGQDKRSMKAFDICPANMVLNYLANKLGAQYDEGGSLARSGQTDTALLNTLNQMDFFRRKGPKSLGKEWVFENVIPILNKSKLNIRDQLRTYTEHVADQVGDSITKRGKLLITGGGAFNTFLVERIKEKNENIQISQAEEEIILYKEAMVFAFLGILRKLRQINCFSSVTGAERDSVTGSLTEL